MKDREKGQDILTKFMEYGLACATSAAAVVALTPLATRVGRHLGIVDVPGTRKVHKAPTPRCGGLAIALAALIGVIPLLAYLRFGTAAGTGAHAPLVTLLGTSLFVLLLGLSDDLFNIPSKYKLLALLAAAAALAGSGARIESIGFGGAFSFKLGWTSWPVTMLWIVGITVAINFIDGLDGLAGGICLVAFTVLSVVLIQRGYLEAAVISLAMAGALAGFLLFNFNPASIFMGDSGSNFVGFVLASTCVVATQKSNTMGALVLPALALSVPLLDTALTMVRRFVGRRSVFSAEQGHIHHRLLDAGLGHKHAVLLLYGVSVAAAGVGLIAVYGEGWATLGALTLLVPLLLGVFRGAGSVRARETIRSIRRNRAIVRERKHEQRTVEETQLRFRDVETFDAWWQEICRGAEQLGFCEVTLALRGRDGTTRTMKWCNSEAADPGSMLSAAIPIPQRRAGEQLRAEVKIAATGGVETAGQRLATFARILEEYSLNSLTDEVEPPRKMDPISRFVYKAFFKGLGGKKGSGDAVEQPACEPVECPAGMPTVAIVHDFLYTYAGAERVVEQLVNLYPHADIFSLFDFLPPDKRGFIRNKPVTTSFIQKLPFASTKHRAYLPFFPLAIEQLDVSKYDIVISSSYMAAKGVLTRPDQLHVCYCHSPVRFAWDLQHQYLAESKLTRGIKSILARIILHYVRVWDVRSAGGVDVFVSNSNYIGRRIEKTYRRQSQTVYPPVDIEKFTLQTEKQEFYLTASRLVPYKKIDAIVDAFAQLPERRLIVVGEGPEFEKIQAKAGPNVKMVGYQSFERLLRYMQLAKAFVFAAEEDFGIVPVEAQACGTPVIAYGRGGVTESVIPGRTGIFFNEQTADSIASAIRRFEGIENWDPVVIRANAERFSSRRFRDTFAQFVADKWHSFRERSKIVVPEFEESDEAVESDPSFERARLQ